MSMKGEMYDKIKNQGMKKGKIIDAKAEKSRRSFLKNATSGKKKRFGKRWEGKPVSLVSSFF